MKRAFIKSMLAVACISAQALAASASIVINEAMPCNLGTYMDMKNYNYSPYVELYNDGATAVNLNGYYFRYKPLEEDIIKEAVIDYDCKIGGGEYMLFYFDKLAQEQHVGYKMDADGGELSLLDASGKQVSSLNIPAMCAYVSYGLGADGAGYMVPTPDKANGTIFTAKSLADFTANKQCAMPVITAPGVVLDEGSVNVTITCATTGAKIYYTTDGTVPTEENGKLYDGPLTFEKSAVVRARAYATGKIYSDIATSSYIFGDKKHEVCMGVGKLPIVSIVTDDKNFKDKTIGIGVKGDNGTTSICSSIGRANYNQDWKRPMNFEYIVNGKTVVNNEIEAKVMGGCSRQYEVKSLSLSANKKCGSGKNKMKYAFFTDKPNNKKYKSLHLRNGGNDYDGIRFRDGFMQSLIHGTSIDYQACQPVAYYINGKYQGLMLLNEHMNEDYLYSNYDLDEEDIDFIKFPKSIEVSSGDLDAYNLMMEESRFGQNTGSYCEKMNKLMDMEEYMTYMAFEQYIVNTDWPGNNLKIWRNRNNGRFRWLLYDTDFGFGMYEGWGPNYTSESTDMLKFCLGEGSVVNWGNGSNNAPYMFDADSKWKTELFANLMKDEEFKTKFLTRYLMLMENNFQPEKVTAKLDSIAEVAYPEFCAMSANDFYQPDLETNTKLKGMKTFANNRPAYVYQSLASYYGGSTVSLTINSNVKDARYNINGLYWGKDSYEGKYISNNQLTVTPIAPEGYVFKNWKLSSSASAALLTTASKWSYLYDRKDAPAGWNTALFDAKTWETGNGTFGYGPNSYDTELDYGTNGKDKPITGYFRATVNVDNVNNYASFIANIAYDDGYILYVNGKEVSRMNISEMDVTYETLADDYTNDETIEVKIDPAYFATGANVIAVEVHQNTPESSDFTFAMNLKAQGKGTGSTSTAKTFSANIGDDFTLQAVFEASTSTGGVMLNEICTSNKQQLGFSDEYGRYGDWIELYNSSDEDVNVAGWFISDNASKLNKYQISYSTPDETVVPAHGYKLIWCDNDIWNGPLHASFKLGETAKNTIILSKNKGGVATKVDETTVPANLGTNNSYGRKTDGAETWMKFTGCNDAAKLPAPSPLAKNGSVICQVCDTENIETDVEKKIVLYPNPVNEVLNVATKGEQLKHITIFDMTGRMVMEEAEYGTNATIGTSHLAKGIYTINVETTDNNVRLKFIKK